jgi:N-acetylmuramoyl-L-alanine amidase
VMTRLVLDLVAIQSGAAATSSPFPTPTPELPPALAAPPPLGTIVIDPGHGGEDNGTKGVNGSREKDLTLQVARRLEAAIESRLGIRVLLTREDDRSVPLGDRTALANTNKADLFLSLHVNASVRGSASGASIFCAAFGREAEEVARGIASERLPAFGGGSRDIQMVPWDLAQIRHLDGSAELARLLEAQFTGRVPLAPHTIERAVLPVLESANMPAVLVEMGFLSNIDQEARLATPEFQSVFVQAVFDALLRFRDYLEQTRHTAAPSIGGAR